MMPFHALPSLPTEIPAMLPEFLAQAASVPTHVQLDLGKLVVGVAATALTALVSAVAFFLRRLIQSFDGFRGQVQGDLAKVQTDLSEHTEHVDGQLREISSQMQRVTQEMFGPNGDNGMRGDLRETKRLVAKRDVLLGRLAERAGLPFEEG